MFIREAAMHGMALVAMICAGALQAQGPAIDVICLDERMLLRWPTNATGFVVEQSDVLPGQWTRAGGTVQTTGTRFELSVALSDTAKFYRLRRPGIPVPPVMGLVQDSQSRALANVLVGERQLSDEGGVFSGAVNTTTSGWMTVQYPGYATAYAKPTVRRDETDLIEVWLTPFHDQVEVAAGETNRLFLGEANQAILDVAIAAAHLTNTPAILGLAQIHPLNVGALFADLEPEAERHLSFAFAVEGFALNGDRLHLAAGATLTANIRDHGGTNPPPTLAWFDPEAGVWRTLSNACQRVAPDRLACTLDRLWPLFGLFETGSAPYLAVTSAAPVQAAVPSNDLQQAGAGSGDYDEAYKRDKARLDKRLKELEEMMEQGIPVDPTADQQVQDILDDMAQNARDFAAGNQNEQGKTKLLLVAQHAILLGQGALAQQLMDEATNVANRLAQDLLSNGDCGRIREMLHMIEQLMLMGGDPALIAALEEKIQRLFTECDLWIGWVRFVSFNSSHHPGLPDLQLQSGGCWSEYHDIKMATHVQTQVLKGEDRLSLNFPQVSFRDPDSECEMSISFYGQPAGATLWLNFEGRYDGYTFSVGQVSPAPGTQPVSLVQRHVMQAKEDEICVNAPGYPAEYPFPNYYSVLMHGFLDSPPITLQEMLESGTRSDDPLGETISGYEKVSNDYPVPNFGRYPFTVGLITWNFIHVKKLLPFEP